ncbi:MAG: hypothetical protein GX879_02830, partial [Bacteroidales bacterium]|nr:hypothetical protein [Bacteroidales bacterium]
GGVSPLLRGAGGVSNTTTKAVSNPTTSEGVSFSSLDDIYEQIGDDRLFTREQANQIINSIKICDPAVGSGHFLVSSLNEIITIKNDLKILQDRQGRRLKEYHVEVVNDELIVTDEDGELFEYNPKSRESQRVQETLFHEKQTIIENCLFGVDLNINSVKICRLRLWIELLKNAYYASPLLRGAGGVSPLLRGAGGVSPLLRGVGGVSNTSTEGVSTGGVLETLPNIDINIKTGNSLISRFSLDSDLKQALKKSKWNIESYKIAVATYRNAKSREQKREMKSLIDDIKNNFRSEISQNDPKIKRLNKLKGELYELINQGQLFDISAKEKAAWNKKAQKYTKEIKKLETEIEEIKHNKIYENAFEWRFEFPEVLNDDGDFIGFDVVIGNPPYIKEYEGKEIFDGLRENEVYMGKMDLWFMFAANGIKFLKDKGYLSFIAQNNWVTNKGAEKLRNFILDNAKIEELIDFGSFMVFDTASIQTMIMQFSKEKTNNYSFNFRKLNGDNLSQNDALDLLFKIQDLNVEYFKPTVLKENLYDKAFTFQRQEVELILNKMIKKSNFQLDTDEVANGIHPHHDFVTNKMLEDLGAEFKFGDGIFGLSDKELEKLNLLEKEKELIKPYFNSKQFYRYYANNENQNWLIYT